MTEESISEFKDRSIETIQHGQLKKKNQEKKSLGDPWNIIKNINKGIMGVPKEKERKRGA